ncbi:MAG TPA: translation initiation factor IF-2 N-terminal domain-containing protein, partial [Gemmatimonadales bacterium]|nr:translation initiation factor IF-2 N-terminal domain-containing protein [Gemmatimonadales bacterium]
MVKTRVHDLAAEFGIPAEQLLGMLREMNIFVRSHMSALEPDQVSAVRVRWEREKRKSAEPAAPKKARRKVVAEPEPAPAEPAKPVRRRRTAAEVAEQEAKAATDAEVEAQQAPEKLDIPVIEPVARPEPTMSLEERARLLFKDLPATPPAPEPAATEPTPAPSGDAPAA